MGRNPERGRAARTDIVMIHDGMTWRSAYNFGRRSSLRLGDGGDDEDWAPRRHPG